MNLIKKEERWGQEKAQNQAFIVLGIGLAIFIGYELIKNTLPNVINKVECSI